MELADTTVHPSTSLHYPDAAAHADDVDAFKRELQDRSFDVGEDEEEEPTPQDNASSAGIHPLIAELREIGMFHFIEKYVPAPTSSSSNTAALDWNTLLKAFGITLVGCLRGS